MEYFIFDKITLCGRIIAGGIIIDKRFLAGIGDVVIVFGIFFAGLVYIGIYGDSIFNIVKAGSTVAVAIIIYYFWLGTKLYQKLGWLKA